MGDGGNIVKSPGTENPWGGGQIEIGGILEPRIECS